MNLRHFALAKRSKCIGFFQPIALVWLSFKQLLTRAKRERCHAPHASNGDRAGTPYSPVYQASGPDG